ncbi:WXG100 family type VII secretion target [Agromyces sp. NPDC058136]|uniref:WXG100 family type VII secretion target n=1 Tax=Agromyces sp. NPDC058136 TaxID=3346354 RepID=UPI0036DDBDD9
MSDFRVTPETLSGSASTLSGVHAELSAQLDRLRTSANALAGQWDGAAQQAFVSRYSAWSAELDHLSAVLELTSAAAADVSEIYRNADERVGALWGM